MKNYRLRILYIYKDYADRRKLYADIMHACGYKIRCKFLRYKKNKYQVCIKDIEKYKPDLIWLLDVSYIYTTIISPGFFTYAKIKGIPIILYGHFPTSTPYTELLYAWRKIDFLFIQQKEMVSWLKQQGLNAYFIPLGFHKFQYYKSIKNKDIDISFSGNAQIKLYPNKDKRAIYLQSLKRYNIIIYGETFRDRLNGIKVESFSTHKKQRKIYARTKINLDLPFINSSCEFYKDKYHLKNRAFEIPATRNFLLTARCPEYLDIFPEDVVGYYDDNIESLKESVKRYLKDDRLREKMAERSYKLVHQKHTFVHRFKKMFKIIKKSL